MTARADVAIVGGGIVGLSTALACAERGLSVTVCDPGETRRRTSYGNAGVIGRGSLFPLASPSVWRGLLGYARNRDAALRIDWRSAWRIAPWMLRFLRAANE